VAVLAVLVVPARGEGHLCMLGLAAEHLATFDLQTQPGGLSTPGRHGLAIEALLLDRQGSGHQVIHQTQHVGAVARAHQQGGAGGVGACMEVAAALAQRVAAATGAIGIGWGHRSTTNICRSFEDWPRTLHSTSRELACNRVDHR